MSTAALSARLLLAFVLAAAPLAAEESAPEAAEPAVDAGWPDGPVEVTKVHQPCVFELSRAAERVPFRLAGVECVSRGDGRLLREALDQARASLAEGGVKLGDARRAKYGELTGILTLLDGSLLNERMLARGHALFDPREVSLGYQKLFAAAQGAAKAGRHGVWGEPKNETHQADQFIGRIATLCGDATGAGRDRDGSWLIYLGPAHKRRELGLRMAMPETNSERPDRTYLSRKLCVTGRVRPTGHVPEITVSDETQILDEGREGGF